MAGILDHDYIFNMKDIATLPQRTVKRLFVLAGPAGGSAWSALDRALKGPRISAKEFMEVFYQTKIARRDCFHGEVGNLISSPIELSAAHGELVTHF